MKKCTNCKITKDDKEFYSSWDNRNLKFYLKPHCIKCNNEVCSKWRRKNLKRLSEKQKMLYHENPKKFYAFHKKYREKNKENHNKYSREYYKKNKSTFSIKQKEYRKNNLFKIKRNERKFRRNNFCKLKKYHSEWVKKNPEKLIHIRSTRRSQKIVHTENPIGEEELLLKLKESIESGICPYCRRIIDKSSKNRRDKWSLDHIVALAKGGKHNSQNILFCCGKCNYSKGKKEVWEWMIEQTRILIFNL